MQEFILFLSNHRELALLAAFVLICIFIVEFIRLRRNNIHVSPAKVTQLINHDHATVIDVRATDLYRQGHIIDAQSIKLNDIKEKKKLEKFKTKPMIVVCNSGMESQKIASSLIKEGYNAYSLTGGMRAWLAAQMPVIKG